MRQSLRCAVLGGLLLVGCTPLAQRPVEPAAEPVLHYASARWSDLPGWQGDALSAALPALRASCGSSRAKPLFGTGCTALANAAPGNDASLRAMIEREFEPWQLRLVSPTRRSQPRTQGLITGYYEPVLRGARQRGGAFQTPLHAVPDDLLTIDLGALYPALQGERVRGRLQGQRVVPYPERAAVAAHAPLAQKVLLWVDDPVDAFFLQIQGSGRVRLADGKTVRLAFADVNGHPYRAIGRVLVERGELTVEQATAPGLRSWLATHPERRDEILNANPSVVFFREEPITDPAIGPRGALGVPLTGGRSIAIDPRVLPLGAPFFLDTTQPGSQLPLQRLVVAQDTGGAIRGGIRADLFWGLGDEAGAQAGLMREQGRLWLLWPRGQPLPTTAASTATH